MSSTPAIKTPSHFSVPVGSMFQATIPKCEKYESSGLPYPEEKDVCLWHPRRISLEQTVQYLQEILQISTEMQLAGTCFKS